MKSTFADWVIRKLSHWLLKKQNTFQRAYLCDFDQISKKINVGDVILVESHNRIGTIIRHVTQSPWTHAALYIGRLNDIEDSELRNIAAHYCGYDPDKQLIIESNIGCGVIITFLTNYQKSNIRILHPQGLTPEDSQKVVASSMSQLGMQYDLRHLLDLARFIFPWGIFPRRWRSSLFEHNALQPTKDICSSMIADAFQSVDYPILPLIEEGYQNEFEFIQRNDRLYTPCDFDYSPYFDVIKYPFFPLGQLGAYHNLPWLRDAISDDDGLNFIFLSPTLKTFFSSPAFAVVGASNDRNKIGNQVLRCYLQKKKKVYPVNPHEKTIEGLPCINKISNLPNTVKSISVITPPAETEKIVEEAIAKGIKNIWMQPGAESASAIQKCVDHNINVIDNGICILKEFGFRG